MKKIKILPSILMLVACVAILGVGVFAVAPTKNTISGSITINASSSPIEIQMIISGLKDGDIVGPVKTIRGGDNFSIGDLAFNTDGVNYIEQVEDIIVSFKIKNLATITDTLPNQQKADKALGAFFAKSGTIIADGAYAKASDVLLTDTIKTGTTTNVEVYASSYSVILPQETITMDLIFTMKSFDELIKSDINYKLFIEEYKAESTEDGFVKLPIVTSQANGSTDAVLYETVDTESVITEDVQILAMPSTITNMTDRQEWETWLTMKGLSLSNNLTYIGKNSFVHSNIRYIKIPKSVQTIGSSAFGQEFYGSIGLCKLIIEDGVKEILGGAFAYNGGLTKVIIPGSVEKLYGGFGSSALKILIINEGVKELGALYWEEGISLIEPLVIPNSVEKIDTDALFGIPIVFNAGTKMQNLDLTIFTTSEGYNDKITFKAGEYKNDINVIDYAYEYNPTYLFTERNGQGERVTKIEAGTYSHDRVYYTYTIEIPEEEY